MELTKNGDTDEVCGRGKGGADDEKTRAISALNNVVQCVRGRERGAHAKQEPPIAQFVSLDFAYSWPEEKRSVPSRSSIHDGLTCPVSCRRTRACARLLSHVTATTRVKT